MKYKKNKLYNKPQIDKQSMIIFLDESFEETLSLLK